MAKPYIRNFNTSEIGYEPTKTAQVKLDFVLHDAESDTVDVTKFEYAYFSDIGEYSSSDNTYASNWVFDNKLGQDTLYVTVTRNNVDNYKIDVFNDNVRTELLASGVGFLNSSITLTQTNYSNVSGTVVKTPTPLNNDGDTANIILTRIATWHTATPLSGTQGLINLTTRPSGRTYNMYWDIQADLPAEVYNTFLFRIQVTEQGAGGDVSFFQCGGQFVVTKQTPIFTINHKDYTNQRIYVFDISVSHGQPTQYRVSETESGLTSAGWQTITNNQGQINWHTLIEEQKDIYVQVSDEYYNISSFVHDTITYHVTAPENLYLQILGSTGKEDYTGIKVDTDGSFIITGEVALTIYAEDMTQLRYYIDGDIKDGDKVRQWIVFDKNNNTFNIQLRNDTGKFVGNDTDNSITLTFKDEAGNVSSVIETIRFNTKVYTLDHKNLKEPDSTYDHQVFEVDSNGNNIVIPRYSATNNQFVRKWDDIFYPETHRYPTNPDGTINETEAINMNEVSNSSYDAVRLDNGQVDYDSERRVTTVDWTNDGSKNYLDMESSYEDVNGGGLRYWVVDNEGYGEFSLDFEHFHLDSNSYGPPYNSLSPYRGDCLVVYDASAPGCVTPHTTANGKIEWTLTDSTKLVELLAYSGSGQNVYSLTDDTVVNADTSGGFTTSKINTTTRICIILYTDASVTNSGFKIKSGPQHEQTWNNWECDEKNGELWIHKYSQGNAPSTDVRMIYKYFNTNVVIDYENGSVTFDYNPSSDVYATYTYYSYNNNEHPNTRKFALYNDDLVDYLDAGLYVASSGIEPDKTQIYQPPNSSTYPNAVNPNGKLTQKHTLDKDRGIVEFVDGTNDFTDEFAYVPKGRIFADYQYHTFLRLSNDGYGNFVFYDETLVADDTPQYKDYTFADIKLVNEGGAILESGKLKFLPRGYDNNGDGTVDQVLDLNRPWDVQEGTPEETYEKTACEINSHYVWEKTLTKSQAVDIYNNWNNRSFGFDVYPKQVFYGRTVWVLGGSSGNNYPTTTKGKKCFSSELEGKFYNIEQ